MVGLKETVQNAELQNECHIDWRSRSFCLFVLLFSSLCFRVYVLGDAVREFIM